MVSSKSPYPETLNPLIQKPSLQIIPYFSPGSHQVIQNEVQLSLELILVGPTHQILLKILIYFLFLADCEAQYQKSSSFEVSLNRSLKKLIKTCKLSRPVPTFSIETNRNQPKESIKISCIINVISNLNGPTSSKIKIVFLITFQLAKIFSGNKQKNEEKGRELPVRLRLV